MKKQKICRLIATVLVACMAFCGCAKEKKTAPSPADTKSVFVQMRLPSSFNPLMVEHQSVRDALSLCYEPLFGIDDKMHSVGVLADNIVISDDCMSAIVTIKDSVLWHDGIKMTSADVVHTIEFLKNTPMSAYYGCVKNIETVKSVDPLSVQLTFSKPQGHIAYSLYFPIIASHNKNVEENIVGTGPYMFENYAEAVSLELKKYNSWHGGSAACDKMTVTVVRDSDAATSAFNAGSINVITSYSFDSENNTPKADSKLTQYPSLKYEFMAFNHKNKFLSSPTVRAAISCAVDRTAIATDAYAGTAVETNAPIHPVSAVVTETSAGVQYSLANAGETLFLEGYSFDENTGLLENADGEKFSFKLLVNKENQGRVKAAQQICEQMLLAGIEVVVEEVNFEQYVSKIQNGAYDVYLGGVTLSNMYDYEFFFCEGNSVCGADYVSESLNQTLNSIGESASDAALTTALVSFDEVFLREQPFCGIVFVNDILISSDLVTGDFVPYPGMPYKSADTWNIR